MRAAKLVESLLRKPNRQTTTRRYRRAILRDLFILDYATAKIWRNALLYARRSILDSPTHCLSAVG